MLIIYVNQFLGMQIKWRNSQNKNDLITKFFQQGLYFVFLQ